jgi:hypothetical protein
VLHFATSITGRGTESTGPLAVQFDDVLTALAVLPRMFIEPDGSFVWRGSADDGRAWQVDGNLIDRGDTLAYVDLNGQCPEERLNELLRAFGWPDATLAFELTRRGETLDEAAFRKLARSEPGAA